MFLIISKLNSIREKKRSYRFTMLPMKKKINLLKSLGFFDEKPVEVGKTSISPRELTAQLLEKKLKKPVITMRVEK